MANWRVIRFVAGGELRFRLEDVLPEEQRQRTAAWHGCNVLPFIDHESGMGYESPESIRKDLLERLKALDRPHMYIEPERVVEVSP